MRIPGVQAVGLDVQAHRVFGNDEWQYNELKCNKSIIRSDNTQNESAFIVCDQVDSNSAS
ncbi:hypothetical protein ABIE66_000450 [Peribacillus sp. B2I2]|uniref:hypothetical protein n=1 Tax=Peribacillus sp. B2I2 TaxID=3156468 RepID=UPI003514286B